MHFIYPNHALAVTQAKAAALATPALNTDGVDVTSWVSFGAGYPIGYVVLTADGASTVTNAALYGFEPVTAQWCFIAYLNNQASISLTSTVGYTQQFSLPTVFTRLAIGGTVSANNVGYTVVPVKEDY